MVECLESTWRGGGPTLRTNFHAQIFVYVNVAGRSERGLRGRGGGARGRGIRRATVGRVQAELHAIEHHVRANPEQEHDFGGPVSQNALATQRARRDKPGPVMMPQTRFFQEALAIDREGATLAEDLEEEEVELTCTTVGPCKSVFDALIFEMRLSCRLLCRISRRFARLCQA